VLARSLARAGAENLAAGAHRAAADRAACAARPRVRSAADRLAMRPRARDLPARWHAPPTTAAARQAIMRHLVQRVLVRVQGQRARVLVTIAWLGGAQTRGSGVRPVPRCSHLSYQPTLCRRVRQGAAAGVACPRPARQRNQAGYRPPRAARAAPGRVGKPCCARCKDAHARPGRRRPMVPGWEQGSWRTWRAPSACRP
jgi:hypothetical protein